MALNTKYQYKRSDVLRDVRPVSHRIAESLRKPSNSAIIFAGAAIAIAIDPLVALVSDVIFLILLMYFVWLKRTPVKLPFKLPGTAKRLDPNNIKPGGGTQPAKGILYIGNDKESNEEIWFTDSDARTHILYLGTTGAGKTVGLRAIAANAMCWSSGFLYIDGKADTDLWSITYAMARRFGRDDDLLIMNYMTGNVGGRVPSNTMNPFSSGSAGYLTNMLTSLMPDAEGDNAMWKERAVALVSALMPCLVWKRENQNLPISVGVIRKYMGLGDIIKLSRDKNVPQKLTAGLVGYLNELPGYVDDAFDDDGQEKPLPPDAPPFDASVPRQQHGYLSMQFTRSLQSLGDDYGFIFDTQAADIDMMDVVLQRRIMITLIPALEKSSDETANLGKIIASTLKGMMGATLGSTVEGSSETAIENKPARSETPFISIFDEVGYYAAQGMAVMAAQARSLGFCLVYAAQDLPAMEKRVKEEARSITANCNIKLFGKLEDPTQTKDFFEKTVGQAYVTEVSGYSKGQSGGKNYADGGQASVQVRARADYDELRSFSEGRAICAFGPHVTEIQVYYSDQGFAKTMRVQRFLPVPPPTEDVLRGLQEVKSVMQRLRSKEWDPDGMPLENDNSEYIDALNAGFGMAGPDANPISNSALALANLAEVEGYISREDLNDNDDAPAPKPKGSPKDIKKEDSPFETGDGQPLSWMDVIGGGSEDGTADTANSDDDGPSDWDDIMADMPGANKLEPNEDDLFNQIFGTGDGDPPIPTEEKRQPEETAAAKTPIESGPVDRSDAEQSIPDEPMSWANLMGMPAEENEPVQPAGPDTSADSKPAEPPQSEAPMENETQKPQDVSKADDGDSGMSWADIIGQGSDDSKS